MLFLKEFSIHAFQKQYSSLEQKWNSEADSKFENNEYTPDFDVFLNQQETYFISKIVDNIATNNHTS